jgi:hypothetical protein
MTTQRIRGDIQIMGKLAVPESLSLDGDITPSAISSTQNDYNPAGLSTATVLRLEASGAARVITGLQGGSDGRIIILYNIGTTYGIQLNTENLSSAAENRFLFTGVANVFLAPNTSIALIYDSTLSRWRAINANASSLQGAPVTANLLSGAQDGTVLAWDAGAGYFTTSSVEDLMTPLIVDDYDGSPSTSPTYQITFSGFTLTAVDGNHMLVQNSVASTFNDGEGDPSTVALTAADGTSSYSARRDHVHAGSWILIEHQDKDGGDAANFDFTSIPSGYRHLKLVISVRSDRASATSDKVNLKINNDGTAGNYYSYIGAHNHSGAESSEEFLGTNSPTPVGYATAATAPTSAFAEYEFTFVGYSSTNKTKDWQSRGGGFYATSTGNQQLFDGLGHWTSTAAINRLTLTVNLGTNFKQYSSADLYGIK